MDSIDTGDQVFNRRRGRVIASEPEGVEDTEGHVAGDQVFDRRRRGPVFDEAAEVEDTEGHIVTRTYPGVATDDELDCRMPLPGEEDERMRHL
ncbi:MAG: hypothetical protein ABR500_11505 [Dermatophilaceae bacterium]|nr:hypothetical protein [Intrasporangiaceae bacterium]